MVRNFKALKQNQSNTLWGFKSSCLQRNELILGSQAKRSLRLVYLVHLAVSERENVGIGVY